MNQGRTTDNCPGRQNGGNHCHRTEYKGKKMKKKRERERERITHPKGPLGQG